MIDVTGLTYRIGDIQVLQNLDLAVRTGEYYALAGRNGAGKSTLIKILLDLIRNIEQGEIRVLGSSRRKIQARTNLSYLPERFDLAKNITGWQYLGLVAGVYQRPLDRSRVRALCDKMELDSARLGDKSSSYSKGMKQKLGLIGCFMLDNPLIILDEPLSGLDPNARYHFKRLLLAERSNERTIFYSTHLLADAEEICDRFGVLDRGRVVFDGSPGQCKQQFQGATLEEAYMRCIGADVGIQDSV